MVLGTAVGSGVFARLEKIVESHGGELADGPPVFLGKLVGSVHADEFKEGGGVDGPHSVGSRICLGKGTQEVTD